MKISEIFCDYIELGTKEGYPEIEELKILENIKVYINKIKTEIFIIVNTYSIDSGIEDMCRKIENCVMGFINFGEEYRETIDYLKYNLTIIFIVNPKNINKPNEKSTRICRKIYVYGKNEHGNEIKDEEVNYFPFYLENLKNVDSKKLDNLERELEELKKNACDLLSREENNND